MTPHLLANELFGTVHVTGRPDSVFIVNRLVCWDWSCGFTARSPPIRTVASFGLPAAAKISCRRSSRWDIGIFLKLYPPSLKLIITGVTRCSGYVGV